MRVGTVVVGYDGSPDACAALDAAIDHVATGGSLHVVTVVDDHTLTEAAHRLLDIPPGLDERSSTPVDPEAFLRRCLDDARLHAAARGVTHLGHLVRPTVIDAVDGGPATTLIGVAERVGADLMAVGAHGLGADRCCARGSVANGVARDAPSSVLIVRHHDTATGSADVS
jgi:nucleotide-binding universal stress UspA family protein